MRRRRAILALVAVVIGTGAIAGVLGAAAAAQPCSTASTDVYTPISGNSGDWSVAGAWSEGVPTGTEVACWNSGTTVTVSTNESVDSIQAGGDLSIGSGGVLQLTSPTSQSSVGRLSLAGGGELDGPSGQTLTVTGNFDWGGSGTGIAALNNAARLPGSNLAIVQTAGTAGSLTIDGAGSTPSLLGGSVTTNSPVSITNSSFTGASGTTLTTTQAVTLGSGVNLTSGSGTIVAAGIDTLASGGTNSVESFALHLTGGTASSLAPASTLNVGNLTTGFGATLPVPSGALLNVSQGAISGTINGAGTFAAGGGTTEIKANGELSTGAVIVPGGTLTVDSGAKYAPATTTVDGGVLNLATSGSTGALSLEGGQLNGGAGDTLSVSGAFDWGATSTQSSAGAINATGGAALTIAQTGGGSFKIDSPAGSTPQFDGGSITTTSPVGITSPSFATSGAPTLTTTSTITLGGSVAISGTGAGFSAAGLGPASGPGAGQVTGTYSFGADALTLTGGATTVQAGATLASGPLTLAGGTLRDDGTVAAGGTSLTGGTLDGTGTVDGAVTNTSATVSPGDGGPGVLTVTGSYTQGGGGTLAVVLAGPTAGSGFSQLAAGGNATVAGTLSVTDVGGFTPTQTAMFAILTSASLSGEFTDLAGNAASIYFAQYGTKNVTLAVVSSSCPTSSFDSYVASGGAWATATNWSTGKPPTAGEVACWATGATVTVSDAESASKIVTGGGLSIANGGALTLGSATAATTSTVGGLTLGGGGKLGAPSSSGHVEALDVAGDITWGGSVSGTAALNAGAGSKLEVIQPAGKAFTIDGSTSTPAFDGGSIVTDSPVTITGPHFATSGKPTLTTTSTIALGGSVAITGTGATFTAAGLGPATGAGAGQVTGTYNFGGAALTLTGGATTVAPGATLHSGALTLTGGTLEDDGTVAAGTTLTRGTLDGSGTVNGAVTNNSGTVAPGDGGPGLLAVTGSYTQGGGATLAIVVGGTTAGSGFSQLQVGGAPKLGGNLSLADVNGFAPGPDDTFPILTSGSALTGAMTLTGPSANVYVVRYDADDVTLAGTPRPANIVAPTITGTADVGQTVSCSDGTWTSAPSSFTYQWNRDGSPITNATDQSYVVSAADRGHSLTCTVTATNGFGSGQPATSAGVPVAPPPSTPNAPFNVTVPSVSGTPTPGNQLSCSNGVWLAGPTLFGYQWNRNGSPIAGATGQTYTVQIADEGATLACTVTGLNAGGAGKPIASTGIVVAKPGTLTCPKPTGKLSGRTLGPLQLGFKRSRAHRTLKRYTAVGSGLDDFCLYGGWGIRAGYASNRLLRTVPAGQRARLKGTIVLALTSNPYYALNGAQPGMELSAVAKRLRVGRAIHMGLDTWYIVPGSASRGVLRVRGGIIQEIGIATNAFTNAVSAQRRLFGYFGTA